MTSMPEEEGNTEKSLIAKSGRKWLDFFPGQIMHQVIEFLSWHINVVTNMQEEE